MERWKTQWNWIRCFLSYFQFTVLEGQLVTVDSSHPVL